MKKLVLAITTIAAMSTAQAGWMDAVSSIAGGSSASKSVDTDAYSKMNCAQLKIEEGKLKKQLTAQKAKEADPVHKNTELAKKGSKLAGAFFGGTVAEVSNAVNSGEQTASAAELSEKLEAIAVYKKETKCKK